MSPRTQRANAIRALSMDAVQKAKSGHPGAPMGMADIAEVLWHEHLNHNPSNPQWINRDRFVLSNGHGSMLLYSLLHLSGYDVTIEDLKNFRQMGAKTPGHPEYGYTPGVETTTGPLGQGLANAVGFAIAEKNLANQFNKPNHEIIDHFTYAFVGDGCLMEGISHEVCSLAGTLKLGKLIVFYDDNGISIDGEVEGWFTDDTPARFRAYGWDVIENVDGHDADAIDQAIIKAKQATTAPTLICCKTIIGKGSPNKQGKEDCHGAPLGEDEIKLVREALAWPHPAFEIPSEIANEWNAREQGDKKERAWQSQFDEYASAYPELANELERRLNMNLPSDFAARMDEFIATQQANASSIASRKASQQALEFLTSFVPELLGGSADLAGSNLTNTSHSKVITDADADGNYINYGVREFGMAAIMNGIALYGGYIPYGGTFLIFMEYARNAVRMAALMKQRVVYVFTHDSIGLGEDGPTHQPIEQLAALRATPNMSVWRPADAVETAVAWKLALQKSDGPTALILSRQNLDHVDKTAEQCAAIERGAYIVFDSNSELPELIMIATGSELTLCLQAAKTLSEQGQSVRVVSMPSSDRFEQQDEAYQEAVLPNSVRCRLAVEAATSDFWRKYVGLDGDVIGMQSFGESAPAAELFNHFGFTVDAVLNQAKKLLKLS